MTYSKRMENPFRPGTASVPPLLAGRDRILNPVDTALASHGNNYGSFFVVHGSRGLGKTSILNEVKRRAEVAEWSAVAYEVRRGEPVLRPLIDQLGTLGGLPRRVTSKLRATRAAWSEQEQTVDLKMYRRTARRDQKELPITDQFVDAVESVVEHLSSRSEGLLLTLDEVQNADPGELSILGPTVQRLNNRGDQSVMIALAGLSSVPSHLSQAFTYSERWVFHPLGNLSQQAAALALSVPAEKSGKAFTAKSLELAAQASGGYPFAVQLVGFNVWNAAAGSSIGVDDVRHASEELSEQLATGLYSQRWSAASPLHKAYLAAAAHASSAQAAVAEICAALRRDPVAVVVDASGVDWRWDHHVYFDGHRRGSVPGLFEYIRRQPDALEAISAAQQNAPTSRRATTVVDRKSSKRHER